MPFVATPAGQGSTAAVTASFAKLNFSAMRRSLCSLIAAQLNHGVLPVEMPAQKERPSSSPTAKSIHSPENARANFLPAHASVSNLPAVAAWEGEELTAKS